MKRLLTFFILALMVAVVNAQRPEGVIIKATEPPVIDGVLDAVWADANVYPIDKPFQTEVPTIGESTWRALWDDNGMYIFLDIKDDEWFPFYMTPIVSHWMADKAELYFDANSHNLVDGRGAAGVGPDFGNYQYAPEPLATIIDGTPQTVTTGAWTGAIYAYKVTAPTYTVEYFIPWTSLLDEFNVQFDRTQIMGFDVTVIDRDSDDPAIRKRAVWANVGAVTESWNNMDDVGYITFEGAEAGVLIETMTLTPEAGSIDVNKGTLQMVPVILPADATNQVLSWSIVHADGQTGRASVSSTGLVTAIADGAVTVRADATDGSWARAEAVITISNQKPTRWDLNLITNGLFNQVTPAGGALNWGGWVDGGFGEPTVVTDGVAVLTPDSLAEFWRYQFNQQGFNAVHNVPYIFSFVAWSSVPRQVIVTFEDIEANGFNRYGASPDPESTGRSEWAFNTTTEPTRFNFNVTFDQIVENTIEKVQFMIGHQPGIVYLDSILVITATDLAAAFPDDVGVPPVDLLSELTVYPNPFNNSITISNAENVKRLTMVNLVGQRVIDMELNGETYISTNHLKSGVYFMIFESTNQQRVVRKMIKR